MTRATPRQLLTPWYWVPYNLYASGRAWHPLSVTLELTYLCNLRCRMCSLAVSDIVSRDGQRRHPELAVSGGGRHCELTTTEYLDLISQIADTGARAISVTGGEPLLRPDAVSIAAAVKRRGLQLGVLSNGTARPETYRDLVAIGVDSVTISIDGTRSVHDAVRGRAGSFDLAWRSIEALADERRRLGGAKPRIAVSCAISALNQHDLLALVDLCASSRIDELTLAHLHFSDDRRMRATEAMISGPVAHLKDPRLPEAVGRVDPERLIGQIGMIRSRTGRSVPVRFTPDLRSAHEIRRYYGDSGFAGSNKCFYAWYATRVDPWGNLYPCWIDVRLGNVRRTGFDVLWNGPAYRTFRRLIRKQRLLPKCATCCVLSDDWWSKLPAFRS